MRPNGHDMISRAKCRYDRRSGGVPSFGQRKKRSSVVVATPFAHRFFIGILAVLGLCCQSGCSRSSTPNPAPAATTPKWNWQSVPLRDRMRLGQLPCRVIPKASVTINSPFTLMLHVNVDRPQTNLPAEFVWATFEPKMLESEKKALEDAKRQLDEKERLSLTLELPKQMLKVAKDMEESHKQVA